MKKIHKDLIIVILIILVSSVLGLFGCSKEYVQPASISITIDDMPNFPENTAKMLNVLKKHKVHATLFCIGEYMVQNPELVNRMVAEGHTLGNHTYTHVDLKTVNLQEVFTKEIIRTQDLIDSFCNYTSERFFRPPYGSLSSDEEDYLTHMDYKVRYWDWDASDWDNSVSVRQIIDYHKEQIRTNTNPNPVVLFHLSNNSIIAMDSLLTYLEQKNIKVVPFSRFYPSSKK
jgi:peptidoglycan/xylan/chitin deacetylase (PgdA/CDA1 family)